MRGSAAEENRARMTVSDVGWRRSCGFFQLLPVPGKTGDDFFDDVEGDRNDENAEESRAEHAADDSCAHGLARCATGAGGEPEWNAAKNESEGGHQNRTQTNARAGQVGVSEGLSAFVFLFSEFDDEDRILGGETDEHDKTDLGIDVVFKSARVEREKSAKDCDRCAEQNTEG